MPRGKARRTMALIQASRTILEEIQPASVRAVCYRLFAAGLLDSMRKTETNRVSVQLTWASLPASRRARQFDMRYCNRQRQKLGDERVNATILVEKPGHFLTAREPDNPSVHRQVRVEFPTRAQKSEAVCVQ